MFDIGFLELMVVAVLGLLVLGPERLPKAARTVGLFVGKVRRTLNNIQDDLERQVRTEELREKLKDPYATFLDDEPTIKPEKPQAPPEGLPEPAKAESDSGKAESDSGKAENAPATESETAESNSVQPNPGNEIKPETDSSKPS